MSEDQSDPVFVRVVHAVVGALVGAFFAWVYDAGPTNWVHMALGGLAGAAIYCGVGTWFSSRFAGGFFQWFKAS